MTRVKAGFVLVALAATGFSVRSVGAQQGTPRGPGYHAVAVPLTAGTGAATETKILLETPHVKLATVLLRKGAVLEEHSSTMPVTIQVISGRGTVSLGAASESVTAGSILALSPGLKHLVRPEPGSDMVLLVHHLKTPRSNRRGSGS